ncbi:hypothetical protein [Paraburkholderia sp. RAU2J]|uniref:hypothetical protein n=1 Tax=Paraburkholderia sp. RAU2J TaxID=1938810 RepID=UPI0011C41B7B|nr:hypothetical protein [Paraburkholderia sp. RAU2J]
MKYPFFAAAAPRINVRIDIEKRCESRSPDATANIDSLIKSFEAVKQRLAASAPSSSRLEMGTKMKRNPGCAGPTDTLKEARWQAGSAPGAIIQQENSFLPLQLTIFRKIARLQQIRIANCYSTNHGCCLDERAFPPSRH